MDQNRNQYHLFNHITYIIDQEVLLYMSSSMRCSGLVDGSIVAGWWWVIERLTDDDDLIRFKIVRDIQHDCC